MSEFWKEQKYLFELKHGGHVVLSKDEVAVLNKLLAGYHTGPEGQKVLDKLRQTA